MKSTKHNFERTFLAEAQHSLRKHHLPRILRCLQLLQEDQIWWRPNAASNSIGNLVLHLEGNVRQWVISGLGGAPDRREREKEFSEPGPLPRRALIQKLQMTVYEACRVAARLSTGELSGQRTIQKFRVTGFEALSHVTDHFAYHTGQILYVTKLLQGKDLGFTRLPGEKSKKARGENLPAI